MTEKFTKKIETKDFFVDTDDLSEINHERKNIQNSKSDRSKKLSEKEYVANAQSLAQETDISFKENTAPDTSKPRRTPITKKQLNVSFRSQMNNVEREMKITQRLVSRLIHTRAIEKGTELLSSTVAKPNAMLYGSIAAFISVTLVYFISKYYGFRITGFEAIGAFIIGWLLGLTYDSILALVHRKGKR